MVDAILLMAEYFADPPLWRQSSTRTGNADPQPLELSDRLRSDLRAWNDGLEAASATDAYGSTVVLSAETPGTTIDRWTANGAESLTVSRAGGRNGAAKAIVGWRQLTQRVGPPFGNAATRATGLRAAGALQRDLGATAQVTVFGGARGPGDY
ncbi:hypothetical protein [Microbacterium mangrovi]|uniref:hypothetical protein n=1 Tax=Microbacterium mangrovi TaxID=1348253 RepID=UPI0012DFEE95|nr:hypothetical protein [Microbacterium mangrovi]